MLLDKIVENLSCDNIKILYTKIKLRNQIHFSTSSHQHFHFYNVTRMVPVQISLRFPSRTSLRNKVRIM